MISPSDPPLAENYASGGLFIGHLRKLASLLMVLLTDRIAGLKYFGQNWIALGFDDSKLT